MEIVPTQHSPDSVATYHRELRIIELYRLGSHISLHMDNLYHYGKKCIRLFLWATCNMKNKLNISNMTNDRRQK